MIAVRRIMAVVALAASTFAAAPALAQAAASAAKKELVQKVLVLSQSGIEAVGTQLAGQTANQALQAAAAAVGRLPADKREAAANDVQAEVRKFFDEAAPLLRESAGKLAPATLGGMLEDGFSEDELKVLVAWLESPVSRKFQQLTGQMQQALAQKIVADSRPQIEPKLKALDQRIAGRLSAATAPAKPAAPANKK